jgi:GT2 family glycosyltransferase
MPSSPDTPSKHPPTVTVVMPAFNAQAFLPRSLPPLLQLVASGLATEVLVVDDGSTDDTPRLATAMGARVLHSGGRLGPAAARNIAAQQAQGELLWFVDADVVVHAGTAERLVRRFGDERLTAVFGSYCDAPPATGFFSQYKNLIHHFHHQRQGGPSTSFWAGCGAVRRDDFLRLGGFDARKFTRPSIEDIEFGHRLSRHGGRIALDPALLCTHLKQWRLGQLLAVDIRMRALPWARLILAGQAPSEELNVSPSERRSAAIAATLLLTTAVAALPVGPGWTPLVAVLAALLSNLALVRFLHRRRGAWFAAAALLFHQVFYVYSSLSYAWCWAEQLLPVRRDPPQTPLTQDETR